MKKLVNTKSKKELLADLEKEYFRRKTISFYRYVKITDPKEMRDFIFANFEKLNCLGRIYIAKEGINAQMNVPEMNFEKFNSFIQNIPNLLAFLIKSPLRKKGNQVS
ncbi:MAG: hypothetical protein R3B39_02900 [Candidatus Paceibacterota bacterium]